MPSPVRVQRTRGHKRDSQGRALVWPGGIENDLPVVCVGRSSSRSPIGFGNRFREQDRATATRLFRSWMTGRLSQSELLKRAMKLTNNPLLQLCYVTGFIEWRAWVKENLSKLRGCNPSCWCLLPEEGEEDLCHGAVLLELANKENPDDQNPST